MLGWNWQILLFTMMQKQLRFVGAHNKPSRNDNEYTSPYNPLAHRLWLCYRCTCTASLPRVSRSLVVRTRAPLSNIIPSQRRSPSFPKISFAFELRSPSVGSNIEDASAEERVFRCMIWTDVNPECARTRICGHGAEWRLTTNSFAQVKEEIFRVFFQTTKRA